ncbi:MAG: hypothetical protein HLX50_14875 [Alteromonadaceae bacterium]|nr:hypothetical protein [Alteromonadaceae bacterium]
MQARTRVLLTLFFLMAAVACYIFGMNAGGFAFILVGLVFEVLFWVGVFTRKENLSSAIQL